MDYYNYTYEFDQNLTWPTDPPPLNRRVPTVSEYFAGPGSIVIVLAMLTHLLLLGILAARIYHFVRQRNTPMAKWPRLHLLVGMSFAQLFYLLMQLLLPLLRMKNWTDSSEASCTMTLILESVSRVVALVYLTVAGLQTLMQVFQPTLLIGNKQSMLWLSMHGVIWILSIVIMSIISNHIVNWNDVHGTCEFDNAIDIYINSYIVTSCVPLAFFILSAAMSVAGLLMKCVKGRSCVTGDTFLQWAVKSRAKAVIFITILAMLTATILVPRHALYGAFLYYMSLSETLDDDTVIFKLMRLSGRWRFAELIFFLLFPGLCLILDEVGAYQVYRYLKSYTCPRRMHTDKNVAV